MINKPLVSVWMITYNHEKYIVQAIESVLMQKTNFDFEIVIGEDCSTDRTREIVLEYKAKYPDKIKLLLQEKNVGIHKNFTQTLLTCTGNYVALLEGDDYWIDENKLQRQVDFLENNKDYVIVFENTREINEIENTIKEEEVDLDTLELKHLLKQGWFMRTGSLLFRNGLIKDFPGWYFNFRSTDYILHILLAQYGKIKFFNIKSSVYRRNAGGITETNFKKNIISLHKENIDLLNFLNTYFNYEYKNEIKFQIKSIYNAIIVEALNNLSFKNLTIFLKYFPRSSKIKLINRAVNKLFKRFNGNQKK